MRSWQGHQDEWLWNPSPSSFPRVQSKRLHYSPKRRHALTAGECFPQALIIKKVGITNVWWEKFSVKSRTSSDTVPSQVGSRALFLKSAIFSFFLRNESGQVPPLSCQLNTMSECMGSYSKHLPLPLRGARLRMSRNVTWFAAATIASVNTPCRSVKRTEKAADLVSTSHFFWAEKKKSPDENRNPLLPSKSSSYKIINLSRWQSKQD